MPPSLYLTLRNWIGVIQVIHSCAKKPQTALIYLSQKNWLEKLDPNSSVSVLPVWKEKKTSKWRLACHMKSCRVIFMSLLSVKVPAVRSFVSGGILFTQHSQGPGAGCWWELSARGVECPLGSKTWRRRWLEVNPSLHLSPKSPMNRGWKHLLGPLWSSLGRYVGKAKQRGKTVGYVGKSPWERGKR